jgi:hypothetical protein
MPPEDQLRKPSPASPEPQTAELAFKPVLGLGNRHLQSVAAQAPWRRRRVRRAAAELLSRAGAEIIDCGHGVRLQGFYSDPAGPARGLVVLLHGWEGSADSSYVLSAGAALLAAGFAVFRLNLRDHGDTQALNEGLFHSCRIDEVESAVARVRALHPSPRLAVVGHSLGGNFALRIAARAEAAGLAVDRVIAVCPVLEPRHTMRALDRGLGVYRHYFLQRWRRSLTGKAAVFPHLYDFGDLRRFKTLTDTTEYFVERYTEFESLDAYLRGYSLTGAALSGLTVPSRIILAGDDPVIPQGDVALLARPPALQIGIASHGGHCGFIDALGAPSWVDREVVADLERFV